MNYILSPSPRCRMSPFFAATQAEGVVSFSVYNQMLMPTSYGHPEEEYWRLINGASMWDVGVERQIALEGPDAAELAQILCPRRVDNMVIGQGKYVPLCTQAGVLINDPILLKVAEDRFFLSIADSQIEFWARAVADERGLKRVKVYEPDVSPLAVQGPKAEDVIASLFGEWVRDIKYFWFKEVEIEGIPLLLARSGWSKQGGFELYLMDGSRGTDLWNLVKEAGKPWSIGPGNPNPVERVESGLLSWGGDTDGETNPFEVRLGRYVDHDLPDHVIGAKALRRIADEGPARQQLGLVIETSVEKPLPPVSWETLRWSSIYAGQNHVGHMTVWTFSLRLKKMIGFGLVHASLKVGETVTIRMNGQEYSARLCELPFL